ncbi:MAG TPA: SpoIIE family protein phosphatase [Balneolaceae bacterium]
MENSFVNKVRQSLIQHKINLLEWLQNEGRSKSIYFGLDGSGKESSGSLEIISKIDTALNKMENGTFGKCAQCSEEVEVDRLILDFTTCVCLDHYTTEQKRELESDLELAAKVQQYLLPRYLPSMKGMQMAVMSKPAGAVGGDYYDFFRYRNHGQGLAIADVMGKGISAGMLMANLQASLRILGPDFIELSALTSRLNELFRYNLKQIRFITLFLATFDPETKEFSYCNAGHHPPLMWNATSNSVYWLKPTGPAIGLAPEAKYTSGKLHLADGDMLVLYTDGLVEARNNEQTEFGFEKLEQYTSGNAEKSPESFINELMNQFHQFGAKLRDDLTLMVLKLA